jgi:mono/diheme cytochrome c family protein
MRLAVLCSLATLALLAACGGEESAQTPPAPPPTPAPPAPPTPPPPPAPTASAACAVPAGSLRGDAKTGELNYTQFCTLCHGAEKPPVQPVPANHRDCKYMGTLSDEHLYKVICGGGSAVGKAATMPSWGAALPPDAIKNVIAYMRSLCPS